MLITRHRAELASFLERSSYVTTNTRPRKRIPLLQWLFSRGQDSVLCRVDADGRVIVSIVPHSGTGRMLIEQFDDCLQACRRHAQLAMTLRGHGFTVVSYGS